jgi:hypothetical protein
MDFVHDQLVTGRKLRVLTIVDMFSRLWSLVSTSAAPMWWRCWKKLVEKWDSQPRSGSTKAPSLCHGHYRNWSLINCCPGRHNRQHPRAPL